MDKWHRKCARWKIMESSRSFSYDTCLLDFAQGCIRDHHSPNGIKNYQREDTNQTLEADSLSLQTSIYGSLIPEIQEARILYLVRK